jgi:hypothetical protein
VRDTYRLVFRVHSAKEFINHLGHVARGLYASGTFNVCRQNLSPASLCEVALAKRACKKVTYRVFWSSARIWFSTRYGPALELGQHSSRLYLFTQEQS